MFQWICLYGACTTNRAESEIQTNFVTDKKKFWTITKPAFTEKGKTHEKIILIEEDRIISDSKQIAELMNDYFINITQSLNIPKYLPPEKNHTPPN